MGRVAAFTSTFALFAVLLNPFEAQPTPTALSLFIEENFRSVFLSFEPGEGRDINVAPGHTYTFRCQRVGGFDGSSQVWTVQGAPVLLNQAERIHAIMVDSESWILNVNSFLASDSGIYSCSSSGETLRLTISTSNPAVIASTPFIALDSSFQGSTTITLQPFATGSPPPTANMSTWQFNGGSLLPPDTSVSAEGLLVLSPTPTQGHSGIYTYTVQTSAGQASAEFTVVVFTGVDSNTTGGPPDISCSYEEYPCATQCFPYTTFCDGVRDCVQGDFVFDESELACSGCMSGFISCQSNSTSGPECVPNSAVCNRISDCSTNFDELLCVEPSGMTNATFPLTMCPEGQSPCFTERSLCLNNSMFCDGTVNCPDQSDENLCQCPPGQLKCSDAEPPSSTNCVPMSNICDGVLQCPGNAPIDESVCGQACPMGSVECPRSGSCVLNTQLCDGQTDCPMTNIDESPVICGCSRSTQIVFQCGDFAMACLERTQICDGIMNCASGLDESADLCSSGTVILEVLNSQENITELDDGENSVVPLCFRSILTQPLTRAATFILIDSNLTTSMNGAEYYPNITIADVVIPPNFIGEFRQCIDIIVIGDNIVEEDEVIVYDVVSLSGRNVVVFPQNMESLVINIEDNDGVILQVLPVNDIPEFSTTRRDLCIQLFDVRGGLERDADVSLNFMEDGFSRPSDFVLSGNVVTFPAFSLIGNRQCLQFDTRKDIIVEDNERMTFFASTENSLDSFVSADNTFSFSILDDDGIIVAAAETSRFLIREDSPSSINLCVQFLSYDEGLERNSEIRINFVPLGNSTREDFNIDNDTVTFTPRSTRDEILCITFSPVRDNILEGDEVFTFEISPVNVVQDIVVVGGTTFTVVIQDDGSVVSETTASVPQTSDSTRTSDRPQTSDLPQTFFETTVTRGRVGATNRASREHGWAGIAFLLLLVSQLVM